MAVISFCILGRREGEDKKIYDQGQREIVGALIYHAVVIIQCSQEADKLSIAGVSVARHTEIKNSI
jgi:hypothetical protein